LAGKEKVGGEKGISRQDAKRAKIRKDFFSIATSFVKHNRFLRQKTKLPLSSFRLCG
jgi:hypothetical protein